MSALEKEEASRRKSLQAARTEPAPKDFHCRPGAEVDYDALVNQVKAEFPKILAHLAK